MNAVKKVLIPTDFNAKSLNVLLELFKKDSNSRFDIILAHGHEIYYSITDLLFYSEYKTLNKLQSVAFIESCNLIQNTYESRIEKMRSKILTGNSKRYVKNFIQDNEIDFVVYAEDYKVKLKSNDSFDLIPYLQSINVEKMVLKPSETVVSELKDTEQLADIFLSNI